MINQQFEKKEKTALNALEFIKAVGNHLAGSALTVNDLIKKRSSSLNRYIDKKRLRYALVSAICYVDPALGQLDECVVASRTTSAKAVANLMSRLAVLFAKDNLRESKDLEVPNPAVVRRIFDHFMALLVHNGPTLLADLTKEAVSEKEEAENDEDDEDEDDEDEDAQDADKLVARWAAYMCDPEKILTVANELRNLSLQERKARLNSIMRHLSGFDTEIRQPEAFTLLVKHAKGATQKPN